MSGCSFLLFGNDDFLFGSASTTTLSKLGGSTFQLLFNGNSKGVISHDKTELHSSEDHWNRIEKSMTIQIHVCLESRSDRNRIIGGEFHVLNESGEHEIKLKTDEKGCLGWRERIEYNYYAPARYVSFTRVIRASSSGNHRGEESLKFAVNIWNERDNDSSPFAYHTLDQSLNNFNKFLVSENQRLNTVAETVVEKEVIQRSEESLPLIGSKIVDEDPNPLLAELLDLSVNAGIGSFDSDLHNTENPTGIRLNYHFDLLMKTQIENRFGIKKGRPLETGKYTVKAFLVGRNTAGKCAKLTTSHSKNVSFSSHANQSGEHDFLTFTIPLYWNNVMPNLNAIYLRLEVSAEDVVEGIRFTPLHSYYTLGSSHTDIFNPSERASPISPVIKNCLESNTLQSNTLAKTFGLTNPVKIWNVLPNQDVRAFYFVNPLKLHEESASLRQLFFEARICFILDPNIGKEVYGKIVPSSFPLSGIEKLSDQRYLHFPFPQNVHLLNRSKAENYCIRFYDKFRYPYYQLYNPLFVYKLKAGFSSYTPVLFLRLTDQHSSSPQLKAFDPMNEYQLLNLSGNKSISLIEKDITLESRDKQPLVGIDRFLNRHISYNTDLLIEPRLFLPEVGAEKLRDGIYSIRVASSVRTLRKSNLWAANRYSAEDVYKEENISSSDYSLVYGDVSGVFQASYPFLMKGVKLSHLRQNLFTQFQSINEKKVLLLYFFSHLYGVLGEGFLREEKDFLSFKNMNHGLWGVERVLDEHQKPVIQKEINAFKAVLDRVPESSCTDVDELNQDPMRKACSKKIKILAFLLEELSKPYQITQTERDQFDLDSFLEKYLFCKSDFFSNRNLCEQRDKWMSSLKSVLGLSFSSSEPPLIQNLKATQTYQVIDNFQRVRKIVNGFLGFSSESLKSFKDEQNSDLLDFLKTIIKLNSGEQKNVPLLLLKVLNSSFGFLSEINQSEDWSVNEILTSTQDLLSMAKELDADSYNKMYRAFFRNNDLVSPLYWSPFVFSNRDSTSNKVPFHQFSQLPDSIDGFEKQDEWKAYKAFTQCQSYRSCHECQKNQEEASDQGTSDQEASGSAACSQVCNSFDQKAYNECGEEQKVAFDYMDYLVMREERLRRYEDLSMCYGMIQSLDFFDMSYISLNEKTEPEAEPETKPETEPEVSGGNNYWLLDPFCKNLLWKELVRIQKTLYKDLEFDIERKLMVFLSGLKEEGREDCVFIPNATMAMDDCLEEGFSSQELVRIKKLLNDLEFDIERRLIVFLSGLKKKGHEECVFIPNATIPNATMAMDDCLKKIFSPSSKTQEKSSYLEAFLDELEDTGYKSSSFLQFDKVKEGDLKNLIKSFGVSQSLAPRKAGHIFDPLCRFLIKRSDLDRWLDGKVARECFYGLEYYFRDPYPASNARTRIGNFALEDVSEYIPYLVEKQYRVFDSKFISEEGSSSNILSMLLRSVENAKALDFNEIQLESLLLPFKTIGVGFESKVGYKVYSTATDRMYTNLNWVLEKSTATLQLKKYEECLVFHRNPKYYLWNDNGSVSEKDKSSLSPEDEELVEEDEGLVEELLSELRAIFNDFDFESYVFDENSFNQIIIYILHKINDLPFEHIGLSPPQDIIRNSHIKKKKGLMLCMLNETGTTKEIEENYFYIESEFENEDSAIIDTLKAKNRPFSLYIRGEEDFLYFSLLMLVRYHWKNILDRTENDDPERVLSSTLTSMREAFHVFSLTRGFSSPGVHKEKHCCQMKSQLGSL